MITDVQKIQAILRHISNVQQSTEILGERLIEAGEFKLGRDLIANGLIHDHSKMFGIEWEFLLEDPTDPETTNSLALAIRHHNTTNLHHPECWGNIHLMPEVYVAEMVCDWRARASEFGSSLIEWINGEAMKRFTFSKSDEIYQKIMRFVNILLEPAFKPVKHDI